MRELDFLARQPRGRRMDTLWLVLGVALLALGLLTLAAAHNRVWAADCASAPNGLPSVPGAVTVCHAGYASLLDPRRREPILVTWRLTGPATMGCHSRAGLRFMPDPLAPAEAQGAPADYRRSGYDLGHMADNADFAWDQAQQRDTFSMANVEPQLPGLNRQGWERGEEMARAWAWQRGVVDVVAGPIYAAGAPAIGADALPVPAAFFKVIIDVKTGSFLAFEMPQAAVAKMPDLTPWLVPIAKVEADTGLQIPLPVGAAQSPRAWPVDLDGWHKAHQAVCEHGGT
jgi:endonuclease G